MTAETMESVDIGILKTFDLGDAGEQIEQLMNRVARLQGDIEQRTSNCEINLRLLSERQEGDIGKARDDYDLCLSRGDALGMGKSLDLISKRQKELEDLARQVRKSGEDADDLSARQIELGCEAGPLLAMAEGNLELAKTLNLKARRIFIMLNDSIGLKIRRLKTVLDESTENADQILSGSEKP